MPSSLLLMWGRKRVVLAQGTCQFGVAAKGWSKWTPGRRRRADGRELCCCCTLWASAAGDEDAARAHPIVVVINAFASCHDMPN